MNEDLNQLVFKAQNGDQSSLEQVVRKIQDQIYHLSMRILVNPDDAHDATQEILILVITRLSTFKGESAFNTWVYRVSVNYLLNAKKVRARDLGLNFEVFREDLEHGLAADPAPTAENLLLLNELRISCTMAMLLCLDIKHRMAYVLGDILELDQNEAADVLGISKENFRKRASRARAEVVAFTANHCGLINKKAKCSCERRLPAAISLGRVKANQIAYARKNAPAYEKVIAQLGRLQGEYKTLQLQKATPGFASPEDFARQVARIVDGDFQR